MKTSPVCLGILSGILLLALASTPTLALSREIGRDIEFPKNYDARKAEAIRVVVRDERFKFVEGIVSYWPPDWATRLSYEGDAQNFTIFLQELRKIKGIGLRLILYKGRNDEERRDSSWQLDFSHVRPNELTVYLNLNSKNIDFYKVAFPEWPANPE